MTPPRLCIFAGTFDPVTFGHLDVLQRAVRLFDHVLMAVARNVGKDPLYTAEERVEMIRSNLVEIPNASVDIFDGLLVEFAIERNACAIIRGLRALSDFEFEFNMALMNRHLEPRIETVFVMPRDAYSYTSSTLVKQVAKLGGDVAKFVPQNVAASMRAKFGR
ncbi:MAG TPA: pantetheine-phosphate adenylyltransferase [Opitutaceae bacterium]|nr:pantetheine-phosphate adenylyltransferase [Opitutaceae bacterium]